MKDQKKVEKADAGQDTPKKKLELRKLTIRSLSDQHLANIFTGSGAPWGTGRKTVIG